MDTSRLNARADVGFLFLAYVALAVAFGVVYITDPGGRLQQAPSVTVQRDTMPLWIWGTVMLTLAVVLVAAAIAGSRMTAALAFAWGSVTWGLWGVTIGLAILSTPDTSPLAPVLPWFVAVCQLDSMLRLIRRGPM